MSTSNLNINMTATTPSMYARRKTDDDAITLEAKARQLARTLPDSKLQQQLVSMDKIRRTGRRMQVTMLYKNATESFHRITVAEQPSLVSTEQGMLPEHPVDTGTLASAAITSLIFGLILGVAFGYALAASGVW